MIRIAVVLQGDASNPGAWSGVPAGVSAGLAAAGVQPVSIDARLPGSSRLARRLGLSWAEESAHPLLAAAGGRRADLSIRTAGGIDGAVMIGSGYSLGGRIPTVTFEDMTLAQALRQPGTPLQLAERRRGSALAPTARAQLRAKPRLLRRQPLGGSLGQR